MPTKSDKKFDESIKHSKEKNDEAEEELVRLAQEMGEKIHPDTSRTPDAVSPGFQKLIRPYYGGFSPMILDKKKTRR